MEKANFIKTIFELFNKNDIQYFVFGEYANLPNNTGDSDIDVVIDYKNLGQAKQILNDLYKKNGVILGSFYTNSTSLFYRFITPQWGVQLDIFYKVFTYKGVIYYPIKNVVNDIILHNNIKVLRIQKGYYIDYLKEIIHLGKAKDKYIKGFIEEINSNYVYYKNEIEKLYGEKTATLILRNLSINSLSNQCKNIQKSIFNNTPISKRCSIVLNQLILVKRLFQTKPGYVIAIIGTDGSGKSTIIHNITPILNEGFHNGIIYNHLRPNTIPDLGIILGKKEKRRNVMVVSNPHAEKQSGLIGSLIRWGYYMIDYTFGYFKAVYPVIHLKSKIFIFDRYYYDYYIDSKRSRINLPKWIIQIGEFFLPKPDLILCLGGDPKKIYERKPETSLEEVSRQTEALKKFYTTHKRAIWIDTCTDIETSTNQAMKAICNVMSKRYSTKFKLE